MSSEKQFSFVVFYQLVQIGNFMAWVWIVHKELRIIDCIFKLKI